MNVSELLVRYLRALGVRHVFGYPGDPTVELLEACRRENLDFVLGRREGTAGLMAEAAGMLTGLPGVCVSTLGPGSTNLVNAVANAWLDRVPMLAISGQIESKREPYFTHQVVDQERLFAPVCKWATTIQPHTAAIILRKAVRTAMAERPGPVHVTTHADVVGMEATDDAIVLPPLSIAAYPGMMSLRCLTLSAIPLFLTKGPIVSATNLPAAQAVITESPSVSITNKWLGILLVSISPETMK